MTVSRYIFRECLKTVPNLCFPEVYVRNETERSSNCVLFCNIFVGGQDFLEYYKPKPGLPKELNAWLANVQRYRKDFRLIRDIAENPSKFGLNSDEYEENKDEGQLFENLEGNDYLDYGPKNDIYPHTYKRKNTALAPETSNRIKKMSEHHKNTPPRLRRHSNSNTFFERRHNIAVNPKSTIGELKRSGEKYPGRFSNNINKRDIQIDVLKDGKMVKHYRDSDQQPKSIILNIQSPDQDSYDPGYRDEYIASAVARGLEKNENKLQLLESPLKIFTPRSTIDLDNVPVPNKEYSSNFKNLFNVNENLNTDSSIARDELAKSALIYRVTLPEPNFYQVPVEVVETTSSGSLNNNGFKDMSHFWTISEKNQLQKGIDFAQDIWDKKAPPNPQRPAESDGFESINSVVVDNDNSANKPKAILINANNTPNKRESETLEGQVELSNEKRDDCESQNCGNMVNEDKSEDENEVQGKNSKSDVKSNVMENKAPGNTTSISIVGVESGVQPVGGGVKTLETEQKLLAGDQVGSFDGRVMGNCSKDDGDPVGFPGNEINSGGELGPKVPPEDYNFDNSLPENNAEPAPEVILPEEEPPSRTEDIAVPNLDLSNPPFENMDRSSEKKLKIPKNHTQNVTLTQYQKVNQNLNDRLVSTKVESVTILEGEEQHPKQENPLGSHEKRPSHDRNPFHQEHLAHEECAVDLHPLREEHARREGHLTRKEPPLHEERPAHQKNPLRNIPDSGDGSPEENRDGGYGCETDKTGCDSQDIPERQEREEQPDSEDEVVEDYPERNVHKVHQDENPDRFIPKRKLIPVIQFKPSADMVPGEFQRFRGNINSNGARRCQQGSCNEEAFSLESERNSESFRNVAEKRVDSPRHQIVHDKKLRKPKHKKKHPKKNHKSRPKQHREETNHWPSNQQSDDYPTYSRRQLKSVEYVYDVDLKSQREYYEERAKGTTKRHENLHKNSVEGDYGDEEDSMTSKRKKNSSKLVKKTDNDFANPVVTTTEAEDDEEYYDEIVNVKDKKSEEKTNASKVGLHSKEEKLVGFGRHLHKKMKPPKKEDKQPTVNKVDDKTKKAPEKINPSVKLPQSNVRQPRNLPNQKFLDNSEFQQWPQFVRNDQINEEILKKRSAKKVAPQKNNFPLASKDYFQKSDPKRSEVEKLATLVDPLVISTERIFTFNDKNTKDFLDEKVTIDLYLDDKAKANGDEVTIFPPTSKIPPGAETRPATSEEEECESETLKVKVTNVCEDNENFNKSKIAVTTVLSIPGTEINNETSIFEEYERLDEILNGHLPMKILDVIYDHMQRYNKLKDRFINGMKKPQPKKSFENLQDVTNEESKKLVNAMANIWADCN
ncbi:uncharacterized protein [Leptinotarsa decemlineata]|uniref:uncharacterized protein n=1 Tax=Leptinotarsa decemlineata TaxID=7539 RepID=UPI003D308C01